MPRTVIILPTADEMLARLKAVNDTPELGRCLYPKITKWAGTKKAPLAVITLLTVAIGEYVTERGLPHQTQKIIDMQMKDFIKAIVTSPEQLKETLTELDEMARSTT